ncbi:hypothetical protein [Methanosarcina mazei]|uniref:Uncharacterized protein n=1 Tax=Methanosarcina mazei S-6 TaxID=213585 RepID=A0A0E3RK88_METMZ|nr:hypothetical protein [Methanosarcina mazei]AKB64930.1 hypothetical protein MSMAS_1734 [Methanosarcina mazei S-6]
MSDTASLQSLSITSGIDPSIIQRMQRPINTINHESLKIINSHSIDTHSLASTFKPYNIDLIDLAFALGSAYQSTVNGMKILINVSKKENSKHTNSLFFDKVRWENHILQFKHPIAVDIVYTNDFLEGNNEELGIFLAASDIEQLKRNFEEDFFVMWDVYSKEPDEKLTKKAKDIKYRILNLISGVSIEV